MNIKMNDLKFNVLLIISLVFVNSLLHAVIKDQKDTGLYAPQDNVESLNANNFNQRIFGSIKPWIENFTAVGVDFGRDVFLIRKNSLLM